MDNKLNLTVLKNIAEDNVFSAFVQSCESGEQDFYNFLNCLYDSGAEQDFWRYTERLILTDDNAFSRRCAQKKPPSEYVRAAYISDLKTIFKLVKSAETKNKYNINYSPSYPFDKSGDAQKSYENLINFYSENGYGIFIENFAFNYTDKLVPISTPSKTSLSQLKNYEIQKEKIENNIINFMNDLPCSNMLLYGCSGTGKSSTIHAILNKYAKFGLKLVEINGNNIVKISEISQKLSLIPFKFILFLDDLTLADSNDLPYIKSSIEGSVSATADNVMIVATADEKRIINNCSTNNDFTMSDECSAEIKSLWDRFGITVEFSACGKNDYISIVKQLAEDYKINCKERELTALAERWAAIKNDTSPRRAKQFIEFLYSSQKRGVKIDF